MSDSAEISCRDQGQILVRANLSDTETASAFQAVLGVDAPAQRARVANGNSVALWFSPDEALVFSDNVAAHVDALKAKLPAKHLVHDATGARVVFTIKSAHVREILAKGCPQDMQSLEVGTVVRSRLGQVAVGFWLLDETTAELVCFRSVSAYVKDWLEMAGRADSLPVLPA